jgi:hypothetical protein
VVGFDCTGGGVALAVCCTGGDSRKFGFCGLLQYPFTSFFDGRVHGGGQQYFGFAKPGQDVPEGGAE